jgi:hypothetical protein
MLRKKTQELWKEYIRTQWLHQKTKKKILELNDTIDQMDLTDVYRIFHTSIA